MGLILATTYPVEIVDFEEGLPVEERPVYIFRRASNQERIDDHKLSKDIYNYETHEEIVDAVEKRVLLRLQKVMVNYNFDTERGDARPEYMDVRNTLNGPQLIELFTNARLSEDYGVVDKKKCKLPFSLDSDTSAEDATQAPAVDPQESLTKLSNSSAQDATDTAAATATTKGTTP